jgi:cyanate lyase
MTTQSQLYERFRTLHEQEGGFIMPNAWDGTSALLLKQAGFHTLAERLEAKRRTLCVTFEQVAKHLGWDSATLTRYLNGTWRIPANRMAALELLLSAKNSDLTDIHRLPRRLRSSRRVGST